MLALVVMSVPALAQERSWIERSDRNTAMVFETLGAFYSRLRELRRPRSR
jgi:hypothetical protein